MPPDPMRRYASHTASLLLALLVLAGCHLSFGDLTPLEKAPAPFSKEAVNFLVVGDWGRNGWFRQDDVARRMGEVADEIEADFVISTGDNFYEDGVESVTDPHWQRSFEAVYTASSLQVPWYVVLGNHDYRGDVEAQIAYSEVSARWTMPARYFAVETEVDDTTRALFVFLDTVALVEGRSATTPGLTAEDVDVEWRQDVQLRWLDSTLAASPAQWRIVVGHHPLYSADAKHDDIPFLRGSVGTILEQRGVSAYIAGHVHSLQHLRPPGTDVDHVVSGAGSLARRVGHEEGALFAAGVSGFMAASLTPDTLRFYFIDHHGSIGYSASVNRRRPATPALPVPEAEARQ